MSEYEQVAAELNAKRTVGIRVIEGGEVLGALVDPCPRRDWKTIRVSKSTSGCRRPVGRGRLWSHSRLTSWRRCYVANNRDPLAALMVALRPVELAANALPREMPDHCKLMVLDRYGGNPVEVLAGDLRRINRLLQQCRMERPLQPYDDTLSESLVDEEDTQPYFPIRR